MTTINIYLNFNGNCEEAFHFYQSVFGGEFPYVGRYSEMPPQSEDAPPMSEEEANKIMHMSLPIGGDTILMGSDTGGAWAEEVKFGNNFTIAVNTDSKEKADDIFNGLSQNGSVSMPMNDAFWGDYFGLLTDQFGINWMVTFANPTPA